MEAQRLVGIFALSNPQRPALWALLKLHNPRVIGPCPAVSEPQLEMRRFDDALVNGLLCHMQ